MGVLAWFGRQREWKRDHIAAFSAATYELADGLTLFQHEALSAVAGFVAPDTFTRVAMAKKDGEYLVAQLGERGAELYIYPNEAGIFGTKPHTWFEEWDFRTPSDLLQALVQECASRAA